jgi:hypothetical protein
MKRLSFLVTLAAILIGLSVFGVSDTDASVADTIVPHNLITDGSFRASNSSASATNTITAHAFAAEQLSTPPQIEWLHWPGQVISHYVYSGGVLVEITTYAYFSNTGDSGTIDFEAQIVKTTGSVTMAQTAGTFDVQAGEDYELTTPVYPHGSSEFSGVLYDLFVTSPAASSSWWGGGGYEYYWKEATFGEMTLTPWVGLNNPPNMPFEPSPETGSTEVPINSTLSWNGGDPDAGDTVTYDIYLGTSETPPLVSGNLTATAYNPGMLSCSTKYYWKIVATDNHDASTEGPVWDFTTGPPEDNPVVATGFGSILDQLVIAYGYKLDEGVAGWTVYNPDWTATHPEWNTLTTLYKGRGYWIKLGETCTLNYGDNIYGLDEGWNLIGWLGW